MFIHLIKFNDRVITIPRTELKLDGSLNERFIMSSLDVFTVVLHVGSLINATFGHTAEFHLEDLVINWKTL